jgi:Berberine and berberine like/Polysaccharide deacetylase
MMTFTRAALAWMFVSLLVGLPALVVTAASLGATEHPSTEALWSRMPPAGLEPAEVPQLVAVTFDDNFGLAVPGSVGGVRAIVKYYAGKHNPAGKGNAAEFDAVPIRTTLFDTSIYMVESSKRVLGANQGEDQKGRNRAAWKSALAAGHEIADHTVNHFNGGGAVISQEDCCRTRDWGVAQWSAEIASCRATLTDPRFGLGAKDVIGFRAPYLSYNDNLFTALQNLGFAYDSSLPNCFNDGEDGTNCSWPYSLDEGSPDADAFARRFKRSDPRVVPTIQRHSGLWELPITTRFSERWRYQSTYAKGKSDILLAPLSDDGIAVLIEGLQNLPKDEFTAILYAYGGAIARMSPQATAFPYRNALGCIQYDLTWNKPEKTPMRLLQMQRLYDSTRPYVSGGAYVNYCDSELQNWGEAYWGPNLPRLKAIKSRFDPDNVFRHAQSIW